jgi:hypothetical protein
MLLKAVQYNNTGNPERTAEKLAKHQALLNEVHDRGVLAEAFDFAQPLAETPRRRRNTK